MCYISHITSWNTVLETRPMRKHINPRSYQSENFKIHGGRQEVNAGVRAHAMNVSGSDLILASDGFLYIAAVP